MKCLEPELLFNFIHHLLEPREEEKVRAHVAGCPACLDRAEEYRKLEVFLDEWKPFDPSPWFDSRVRQAVTAEADGRSLSAWLEISWGRWLAPATMGVLVVAASLVILRSNQSAGLRRLAVRATPSISTNQQTPSVVQPAQLPAVAKSQSLVNSQVSEHVEKDEPNSDKDLSVFEDYDMLANFDVLSELPQGDQNVVN